MYVYLTHRKITPSGVWFNTLGITLATLLLHTASAEAANITGTDEATTLTKISHFKSYVVEPRIDVSSLPDITVEDRLDQMRGTVDVLDLLYLEAFANPVIKQVIGGSTSIIQNNDHHLTIYSFQPVSPRPWTVRFKNQFGTQIWRMGSPERLLIPARKHEGNHKDPEGLDHFKCYGVTTSLKRPDIRSLRSLYRLTDQWSSITTRIISPVAFCLPARKKHEGNSSEIYMPDTYLAIYKIWPGAYPHDLTVTDQFGKYKISIRDSSYLFVPSGDARIRSRFLPWRR